MKLLFAKWKEPRCNSDLTDFNVRELLIVIMEEVELTLLSSTTNSSRKHETLTVFVLQVSNSFGGCIDGTK